MCDKHIVKKSDYFDDDTLKIVNDKDLIDECPICYKSDSSTLSKIVKTKCKHFFCYSCIVNHIHIKSNCPICRKPVYLNDLKKTDHREVKDNDIVNYTGPMFEKIEINEKFYYINKLKDNQILDNDLNIVGEIINGEYIIYN